MSAILNAAFLLTSVMLSGSASAGQASQLWQDVKAENIPAPQGERAASLPSHYRLLKLDRAAFVQRTNRVPQASTSNIQSSHAAIELPMPEGGYREFRIVPSGVLPKALAEKYPGIHSYAGELVGDPSLKLRLDWSPAGLHAMVVTSKGAVIVEPYPGNGGDLYLSFYKHDAKRLPWRERGLDDSGDLGRKSAVDGFAAIAEEQSNLPIGDKLRTYRLAVAADSQYSQFFEGTQEKVLASIVRAVNRVNGVYEQELSVRFQLAENNEKIIFLNRTTDPYDGLDDDPLELKNLEILDREIGSENYDIGHLFNTTGGGQAEIASVCDHSRKARGYTGSRQPIGDAFWVDFVAHEIGHQMGGRHTFNSPIGNCRNGREEQNGYEVGSGVSIMGYAGLCSNSEVNDNIQKNSIPFFHVQSIEAISVNVWSGVGNTCGTVTPTGNTPPTADAGEGTLSIPKKTPFFLRGQGNDTDNDRLNYAWEEYDAGQQAATVQETQAQAAELGVVPIFRSFPPRKGDQRVFPQVSSILSGDLEKGEVLPGYSRPLSFRLVVRDGKGGVAASAVRTINVIGDAGPFTIAKPAQKDEWSVYAGTAKVQWDVARTDQPPISCNSVNIALSLDDGKSYSALAAGAANDGEQVITVPNTPTHKARVRIICSGKSFGNISERFVIKE